MPGFLASEFFVDGVERESDRAGAAPGSNESAGKRRYGKIVSLYNPKVVVE